MNVWLVVRATFDPIDAIAAMLVPFGAPRVKDDVHVLGAAQRIGFDTPRPALIVEVDAEAVGGGKSDDLKMRLGCAAQRQAQRAFADEGFTRC